MIRTTNRTPISAVAEPSPVATAASEAVARAPARDRAERLGHTLAPIQRVIYSDKGKKPKNAFKDIARTKWYGGLDDAKKAWAHQLHGKPDEHYNLDEMHAKLDELATSGATPPELPQKATKKRKRETPTVARQTGPAVGTQVDYATAPQFRTERRTIRRLRAQGKDVGDKNLYTKRYKPPGARPFKLITSSLPPSSLPKNASELPLDELVESRLGQSLHSEGVTDKIEDNYEPLHKKQKIATHEHYSASSREQCEKCRYNFPPQKPGAHVFGSFYSGTTDHVADKGLRDKLIANKGVIGKLDLSPEQRTTLETAREDAAAARQHDHKQNPLLTRLRKQLEPQDSDDEHSSDDDDLFVTPDLHWGDKGWGKGKVHRISMRQVFSSAEFEREKQRTQELLAQKQTAAAADDGADSTVVTGIDTEDEVD